MNGFFENLSQAGFWIQVAKTLHFVGLISWMAGIFYMPRLLVYVREALDMPSPEKEILVKHHTEAALRLHKIIMQPAMIITFIAGTTMILLYGREWFKFNLWLHVKFSFLFGLVYFHFKCKKVLHDINNGNKGAWTSTKLRMFNELPTILLLGIVLLAVFRNGLNLFYALIVLVIFAILLLLGIRLYKRVRTKAAAQELEK